jgi:hypothetical protein
VAVASVIIGLVEAVVVEVEDTPIGDNGMGVR